jgi:hypothetical protein
VSKTYRLSRKIYSDPVLEILCRGNIRAGISFVISIEGNKRRRFLCIEDAWAYYNTVADKTEYDYLHFVGMLASGLVVEVTQSKKEA